MKKAESVQSYPKAPDKSTSSSENLSSPNGRIVGLRRDRPPCLSAFFLLAHPASIPTNAVYTTVIPAKAGIQGIFSFAHSGLVIRSVLPANVSKFSFSYCVVEESSSSSERRRISGLS